MNNTFEIILFSDFAGFPIIIGGLISCLLQKKDFRGKRGLNHFVTAFGGGALLSAIAFVLVPKAVADLSLIRMIVVFLAGSLFFMALDIISSRIGGSIAQVLAMMMDFIPEALALGASFAADRSLGMLIAMFIGMQNLPEGFNSYLELNSKLSRKKTLLLMLGLSFVGIIAALTGEFFLTDKAAVDSIMLFAGGGILYLIFQDIAPAAKLENNWLTATGACLGFMLGMVGEKLI